MRPAPSAIPTTMPSYDDAVRNIVYLMDMPRAALCDMAISELVNLYDLGTPKWLTGSTVWLPAVFNQVDKNTDLDIVYKEKDACDAFAEGALKTLTKRMTGYSVSRNGNNGWRFFTPDGTHIIDTWHLEADESIEELLMTYPEPYQRAAYYMTWSGSSPGYLTRIVKDRPRFTRGGGIFGRIERAGGYGR